jgi:SAM-dependent methyltransferase
VFQPIVQAESPCKCCGTPSPLAGSVDFHRNCEQGNGRQVLKPSGIPIHYHRCPACGFIFTNAMDHFTTRDFCRWIYNDEYALVDPEYARDRPEEGAKFVARLLGENKSLSLLDYGSGSGLMSQLLRGMGFKDVQCFDPFVQEAALRPAAQQQFDCILCFEVIEHSTDPRRLLGDIVSMLRPGGVVLCSTLVQPENIGQIGLEWWYVAPRNGHVSLFSRQALMLLADSFGLRVASFNAAFHVMVGARIPQYAVLWFGNLPPAAS